MPLYIKLSTTLRKYVPDYDPEQGLALELENQPTAKDIAIHLGLPLEEIKFLMLNGRYQSLDTHVKDNDRLAFFPAVGGG